MRIIYIFFRSKAALLIFSLFLLALGFCGCNSLSGLGHERPPVLNYPVDYAPLIFVLYEPYPQTQLWLEGVVPMPSYQGWTDERMTRDLNRLHQLGLHGLFLCLRPESLAEPFVIERIARFYELIELKHPGFSLALMIVPGQKTVISRQNIVNYLRKQGILDAECILRLNGRPCLGFAENVALTDQPISSVSIRQWGNEWQVRPRTGDYGQVSAHESFIWVCAGYAGAQAGLQKKMMAEWPQPRDKHGDFFRMGLRHAFAAGAAMVCIDSWNDFVSGSFIEPNNYDQELMCRVLQEEMNELARQRNKPQGHPQNSSE
jgi:hypothetical protein